jgi:hypothetical protein
MGGYDAGSRRIAFPVWVTVEPAREHYEIDFRTDGTVLIADPTDAEPGDRYGSAETIDAASVADVIAERVRTIGLDTMWHITGVGTRFS